VPTWATLDEDERSRLEAITLDEEMQITIAGQAALLVLGLGEDAYRAVSAIIVHPTTVVLRGERAGPVAGTRRDDPLPIVGQASGERGPLVIAWDAVLAGVVHPERGENVVQHEFAHKLDMLDGYADGMPPVGDRGRRARWAEVFGAELEALRSGGVDPVLRPYAATDAAELFAVATEAFFNAPADLAAHKPLLYGLLAGFYRQDPAARLPPPDDIGDRAAGSRPTDPDA
jgi:Mlc titration factor MtfA (ptsG expression regulator)